MVIEIKDNDKEDLKALVSAVEKVVESHRRFYLDGVKKSAMETRKNLQTVRSLAVTMRKQVQSDKVALKATEGAKPAKE